MRGVSLFLLVASTIYAQSITNNGYPIPDYDPLPTDGDPEDKSIEDDWAPHDHELGDGHGHGHGYHGYYHGHGGAHGELHGVEYGGPLEFSHQVEREFHVANAHGPHRHYHDHSGHDHHHGPRPVKVVVHDKHSVVHHPKKPCKNIVKHVDEHVHVPHHHHHHGHHHHHDDSSSSEECGCRAHRHGYHHGHHGHGHHHAHDGFDDFY